MRLIDHYHADLAGLGDKAALATKRLWFRSVSRYLTLLDVTSDPILPHTSRTWHPSEKERADPTRPAWVNQQYEITTLPVAAFFLNRDIGELEEVYRVTKDRNKRR